MNDTVQSLFSDENLISVFTRAQALEDGVLVDVSATAKEAGFRYPVAVSSALWADICAIPLAQQGGQDIQGRLWDVLWMGLHAIRASKTGGTTLTYKLILPVGRNKYYWVKLVCGPGDAGEPVLTLMTPDED